MSQMDRSTALEMAEAFSTDCMNGLASLEADAEAIVEHLWGEVEDLRGHIIELRRDCSRLRAELDEVSGVIR